MEPVGSLAQSQVPASVCILSQIKPAKQFKKQLKNYTHPSLTEILIETANKYNCLPNFTCNNYIIITPSLTIHLTPRRRNFPGKLTGIQTLKFILHGNLLSSQQPVTGPHLKTNAVHTLKTTFLYSQSKYPTIMPIFLAAPFLDASKPHFEMFTPCILN
jgi:hypothetical protein